MQEDRNKSPRSGDKANAARLKRAADAARAFCRHFEYPPADIDQISGRPIQPPLTIERDGVSIEVYRWLGHGRGASYVQVELSLESGEVTVHGAIGDRGLGPWKP
jgi:hypothetical protein